MDYREVLMFFQFPLRASICILNSISLFLFMRRPTRKSRFTTLAVVFVTYILCSFFGDLCYGISILDYYFQIINNDTFKTIMQFTAYVIEFLPIIACAVFALDRALVLALPVLYGPWRIRHRLAVFVTVFEIGFIVALYIVNFLLDEVIYALEDILQVAFFGALFFETVMYAVFIFILRLHHKRVSTTLSSENKQTNHIVLFQAIIHTLLSTIPNAVSTAMYFMPEENDIRDPVIDGCFVSSYVSVLIVSIFTFYKLVPKRVQVVQATDKTAIS
ncbi:hypothetical protein QR680_011858 [Steinernema hermaphroditum]|uniref:Uncharacterized protein n=1 Tax=Steinernema hermaphroditum TaxID=289476 RepID=A0AA39HZZ7_9BILA|nr:hypothetical protein QR680_011858 [Steinernema hermaphroditum]